jgi:hypothetical protein
MLATKSNNDIQVILSKRSKRVKKQKSINFEIMEIQFSEGNDISFDDHENVDLCCINQSEPLSYVIKIGQTDYKIDFDLMKQINLSELWRKRTIKRLDIHQNINNLNAIFEYLKSQNVVGISGQKFDFLS